MKREKDILQMIAIQASKVCGLCCHAHLLLPSSFATMFGDGALLNKSQCLTNILLSWLVSSRSRDIKQNTTTAVIITKQISLSDKTKYTHPTACIFESFFLFSLSRISTFSLSQYQKLKNHANPSRSSSSSNRAFTITMLSLVPTLRNISNYYKG